MLLRIVGALCLLAPVSLFAAESDSPDQGSAAEVTGEEIAAGHSYHGEAFNEGPRQSASLLEGMAEINFPSSAKNQITQNFIEQGIAQLHGFWYLEAERSFRQAATLEPDLAIPYWGMAMANTNNAERARGLIDKAMERREQGASPREKLYIEALDRFLPPEIEESKSEQDNKSADRESDRQQKQKRAERYLQDLEAILDEFPEDIEARAFLAVHLWEFERVGVKMPSRYATDALLGEVFAERPMHPAHHYRIHLWDRKRPQNALESAAKCGPSSPGIAHMWHMPGHIYSRLKRYSDAAWQQEASARVDHQHMQRARLIPDQIHNYAHNNEWLIRNLLYVGRVNDALEQARNLVALPRHPGYNTLEKRGSFRYGRQRLLQTLTEYGLWKELIAESGGHFLTPTDDAATQEEWLSWLAVAHFMNGDTAQGGKTLRSLRRRKLALHAEQLDRADAEAGAEAEVDAAKPTRGDDASQASADDSGRTRDEIQKRIEQLRVAIARAAAAAAAQRSDQEAFEKHATRAKLDKLVHAQWLAKAGDLPAAITMAEKTLKDSESQVRPLAVLVDLLWQDGRREEAKQHFEKLREVAGSADLETPLLAALRPVAAAAGQEGDWRIKPVPAADLGARPPLDQLGPFRWQPYTASSWGAKRADGELVASEELSGKPHILIFYLGFGCLHCVEQLHAFEPQIEKFRQQGIEVLAISTESIEQLQLGIKNFDQDLKLELLSDADQHVFKTFRCWDDFEDQPLHGTFLIDSRGRVRWQDISYEPFTDAEFLLDESKRLLTLP